MTAAPAPAPAVDPPAAPRVPKQPNLAQKVLALGHIGMLLVAAVFRTLFVGPERPNRSKATDIFVRTFRSLRRVPAVTVHSIRHASAAGLKRAKIVLKGCTVEPAVQWRVQLESTDSTDSASAKNGGAGADAAGVDVLPLITVHSQLASAFPTRARSWTVTAEWIVPTEPGFDADHVVLFFHGGGYCIGSAPSYRMNLAPLCKRLRRRFFNVEYRLSPEAVFPDALHDAVSAFLYLTQVEGIQPENITVMGDSAGGNLAHVLTMFLRDHDLPLPGGSVLLSPWVDLAQTMPSVRDYYRYDYLGGLKGAREDYVQYFLGTTYPDAIAASERYVSPILDGIAPVAATEAVSVRNYDRAMPPTYICVGGDELLLDSDLLLAVRLARTARVHGTHAPVVLEVYEHQIHVFPFMAPRSADARTCREQMCRFIESVVDAAPQVGKQLRMTGIVGDERYTLETRYFRRGEVLPPAAATAFLAQRWSGIRATTGDTWEPIRELELPIGVVRDRTAAHPLLAGFYAGK
ncbi:hypothetical protein AMAG_02325 [Allomyces macrogynus ATCC 38327]|uniref:Alpha/beta hydrolase fold-3 domain-containing protein n=1 Tax=Allomyces macrogynus (strain ATCC 38327) TaxID=578462 RepID=A0A0L0S2E4_ALLM3|nr:hypothetical protein AMAG_02325 [Allomyces macrogynus ATCC 38327]|eukprot:KNE56524.1 hypothetical protein AMAG_02325 [Allomyces macrogynus ATCC 38327]